MMERRRALGGSLPRRVVRSRAARSTLPGRRAVRRVAAAARAARRCRPRWPSPACCATWRATSTFGQRVVPIIPDEARTFGMDALFRELKIYAVAGPEVRAGRPRPAALLHRGDRRPDPRGGHHRGRRDGQLHRRRPPATPPAACRWCPSTPSTRCSGSSGSATSSGRPPTPGPAASCWAPPPGAPRCSARACSTRTATASCWPRTVPPVPGLRPGLRLRDGHHRAARPAADVRRRRRRADVFYYLTLYNENYPMPPMPERPCDRGRSCAGLYRWPAAPDGPPTRATVAVLRLGAAAPPAQAAAELAEHYDVGVELWSATSYKALREEALGGRALEPPAPRPGAAGAARDPSCSADVAGPDRGRHRLHEDRARAGRPLRARPPVRAARHRRLWAARDTREALRRFFEVDAGHVVVAVLARPGRRRARSSPRRWPTPSPATASTPTAPAPPCPSLRLAPPGAALNNAK